MWREGVCGARAALTIGKAASLVSVFRGSRSAFATVGRRSPTIRPRQRQMAKRPGGNRKASRARRLPRRPGHTRGCDPPECRRPASPSPRRDQITSARPLGDMDGAGRLGSSRRTRKFGQVARHFRHCPALVYPSASENPTSETRTPMRIQAAVLRQAGLEPPYAQSKPLEIMELDLSPARPRRSPGEDRGGGPLPFGPVGDRRLAPAPDADGARPRGGGNRRGRRRRRDRSRRRRSRGAGVRPKLRPLRPVRFGTSGALRAGGESERRRDAALRRAAAFVRGRAGQSSSRRRGFFNPCGGGARSHA